MRYTYVFVGLTPSERALLESLFALDDGEGDELVPVAAPEDAHLIVVNGDDASVVGCLRQNNPHALMVLVGQPVGPAVDGLSDLPTLRRPLEMVAVAEVLAGLDWPAELQPAAPPAFVPSMDSQGGAPTMLPPDTTPPESIQPGESRPPVAPASSFAPTTASVPISVTPAPVSTLAGPAVSARATWAVSEQAPLLPPNPRAERKAWRTEPFTDDADADVMVVVGSLRQRAHTLPRGIRRLGFRVRLVEGADAALAAYAQRPLPFVFLDQTTLGDALLPLARALSAQRPMPGQPPHVVVVARGGTAFDRLRARMIGCAWMAVPVERERLLAFLARRGLVPSRR